jgi:hypothetical protein
MARPRLLWTRKSQAISNQQRYHAVIASDTLCGIDWEELPHSSNWLAEVPERVKCRHCARVAQDEINQAVWDWRSVGLPLGV